MSGIISGFANPTPLSSTGGVTSASKPTTLDPALAEPIRATPSPPTGPTTTLAPLVDKGVALSPEQTVVELRGELRVEQEDREPRANRGQLRKRLNQLARAVKNELRQLSKEQGLGAEAELELRAAAREFKSELKGAFRDVKNDIGRDAELDGEALLERIRTAFVDVATTASAVLAPSSADGTVVVTDGVGESGVTTVPVVAPTETAIAAPAATPTDDADDVAPIDTRSADLADSDPLRRLSALLESFIASLSELVASLRTASPNEDDVVATAGGDDAAGGDLATTAREEPAYRIELELYARITLVTDGEATTQLDASA